RHTRFSRDWSSDVCSSDLNKYQSPYYRYTDTSGQEHEVWFEDARSVQVKYETVREYGLRGVSYWVLGNPFPQNWPVLQSNFTIQIGRASCRERVYDSRGAV